MVNFLVKPTEKKCTLVFLRRKLETAPSSPTLRRRTMASLDRSEQEMKKKKGGKGLSVLSGRDLYEYKKSLFDAGDQEEDVDTSAMEDNDNEAETEGETPKETEQDLAEVVARVESNLFLEGDDDDLEDLDDLEDG